MSNKKIDDSVTETIARIVAENIPKEVLYERIEDGVRNALSELKVDAYDVKKYLKDVVEERAKELLRTTYAKDVDMLANKAVAQVLNSR